MNAIIASVQRKGGVGKTTLAIAVASELSLQGCGVALIDADPQRSAVAWAEPGRLRFPVFEMPIPRDAIAEWAAQVRAFDFEFIVIDTAPREEAVAAAIAVASLAIIPCTPSGLDVDATLQTLGLVKAVRARRDESLVTLIVPNRVDPRTLEGRQLVQELNSLGEHVGPVIGDRAAFVRSFARGEGLSDFAPKSPADCEMRSLVSVIRALLLP